MNTLFHKLEALGNKYHLSSEKVIPALILVAGAALLAGKFIHLPQVQDVAKDVTLVVTILVLGSVMVVAGFVVVKALFHVATGLSLLIFISQSYCAAQHASAGDSALRVLLLVGMAYVAFDFLEILYLGLKEYFEHLRSTEVTWSKILVTLLFLGFAFFFMRMVYLVTDPIIASSCVFQ